MREAKELIQRLLASDIRADLLMLFHKNPGLRDTIEGVAMRIGRTADEIEEDVKALAEINLLQMKEFSGVIAVSLNQEKDKEIQEAIAKHIGGEAR